MADSNTADFLAIAEVVAMLSEMADGGSIHAIIESDQRIGGSGVDLRSKAMTLPGPVSGPQKLPIWKYDGSITGEESVIALHPKATFKDPFKKGNNILVMCDAYTSSNEASKWNKRCQAEKTFRDTKVASTISWFGIDQEFILMQKEHKWPLGWPVGGYSNPEIQYCCGVGADKAAGRRIVDYHYIACLYAGIGIRGISGGDRPGQWKFRMGPKVGLSLADELWVARYILKRIGEIADVLVSFDPFPIQDQSTQNHATIGYSTQSMRNDKEDTSVTLEAVEKLKAQHRKDAATPTGCSQPESRYLGEVGASDTFVGKEGYLVYRRAASDMDPYEIMSRIAKITIL